MGGTSVFGVNYLFHWNTQNKKEKEGRSIIACGHDFNFLCLGEEKKKKQLLKSVIAVSARVWEPGRTSPPLSF